MNYIVCLPGRRPHERSPTLSIHCGLQTEPNKHLYCSHTTCKVQLNFEFLEIDGSEYSCCTKKFFYFCIIFICTWICWTCPITHKKNGFILEILYFITLLHYTVLFFVFVWMCDVYSPDLQCDVRT